MQWNHGFLYEVRHFCRKSIGHHGWSPETYLWCWLRFHSGRNQGSTPLEWEKCYMSRHAHIQRFAVVGPEPAQSHNIQRFVIVGGRPAGSHFRAKTARMWKIKNTEVKSSIGAGAVGPRPLNNFHRLLSKGVYRYRHIYIYIYILQSYW